VENFDPKKWINETLSSIPPGESVEDYVSSLRIKLQVIATELSASLEDLKLQCVSRMPKAIREIETIKKEIGTLKTKINKIQTKLEATQDSNTEKSIQVLTELEQIKTRMESCNNVLFEASKFTNLTKSIDQVFEKQDVVEVANLLVEMEHSVCVLKDIPEFQDSAQKLTFYKEKLESLVRPKLIQAFNQHNTEGAQKHVELLKRVGMMDQVIQTYYKCRLVPIQHFWTSYDTDAKKADKSPSDTKPFIGWLASFYNEVLLRIVGEELDWTSHIFDDSHTLVAVLILEVCNDIKNTFVERLRRLNASSDLLSCYTTTKDFCRSLERLLKSNKKDLVLQHVIAPFVSFQLSFGKALKHELLKQLEDTKPAMGDYLPTIHAIESSMAPFFLSLESAVDRFMEFTDGAEVENFISSVLNEVICEYISHLHKVLVYLRQVTNVNDEITPMTQTTSLIPSSSATFHFHDWKESYFQGAIQLLEIMTRLMERLHLFDKTFKLRLLHQKEVIFPKDFAGTSNDVKKLSVVHLREEPERTLRFYKFLCSLENPNVIPLRNSIIAMKNLITATRKFVFDTMFSYIKDKLRLVPQLEEWRRAISDSNTFVFSLSPQGYIKLIVEHILVLSQLLEPYNENETLSLKNVTDSEVEKFVSANVTSSPRDVSLSTTPLYSQSSLFLGEVSEYDTVAAQQSQGDQQESANLDIAKKQTDEINGFAYDWILLVVKATIRLYTVQILQIPQLTDYGSHQLAVDIGHFFNMLSVLGIEHDPILSAIQNLAKLSKEQYKLFCTSRPISGMESLIIFDLQI
jgi:hypothetical protein